MTIPVQGFPAELVSADLGSGGSGGSGTVTLGVDEAIYPIEAVYGAAYIFIDRCYVLLDRPAPGRYRVSLTSKKGDADEPALRALVGEFANELLSCAWRHQITQQNRASIESVTMQAIGSAMGPPSLDDLAAFDFTEEAFDDPLGIAVSWEEKYKKKDKATAETSKQPASPSEGDTAAAPAPAESGGTKDA